MKDVFIMLSNKEYVVVRDGLRIDEQQLQLREPPLAVPRRQRRELRYGTAY